jgi:hypothetical protein
MAIDGPVLRVMKQDGDAEISGARRAACSQFSRNPIGHGGNAERGASSVFEIVYCVKPEVVEAVTSGLEQSLDPKGFERGDGWWGGAICLEWKPKRVLRVALKPHPTAGEVDG